MVQIKSMPFSFRWSVSISFALPLCILVNRLCLAVSSALRCLRHHRMLLLLLVCVFSLQAASKCNLVHFKFKKEMVKPKKGK